MTLSPLAIRLLFPKFYPTSATAAQIASLAVVPAAAFSIWAAGELSEERPVRVLAVNLVSISVLVASITLLGRVAGVAGLAVSLVIYRSSAAILSKLTDWARPRQRSTEAPE